MEGDNADPDLHDSGKADGLEEALEIAYGDTSTGSVDGRAFSMFTLSVEPNDLFEVEVTRTSGDYDPRSVVYDVSLNKVDHVSGSFIRTANGNKKQFQMGAFASRTFIVVRADEFTGSGDFEIQVRCVAGPCTGDPLIEGEAADLGLCLSHARICAFDRLTGPTDAAQADALLQTCLVEKGADLDLPVCADACSVDAPEFSPKELCADITDALVFYGDQSAACRGEFDFCLDDCTEREENSPFLDEDPEDFEFWMNGEAICWGNRFGDSCDEFARAHTLCGGSDWKDFDGVDTAGTCFARWRATQGAWLEFEDDNIDCSDTCTVAEQSCFTQCANSTDESCFDDCALNHELLQDDDFSVCQL